MVKQVTDELFTLSYPTGENICTRYAIEDCLALTGQCCTHIAEKVKSWQGLDKP
jgi:hypothetical protein